jgi:hypothetical protein
MKYCEDCKWHGNKDTPLMLCLHPKVGIDYRASPVFNPVYLDTGMARGLSVLCGPDGKLWEAKDAI